MQSSLQTAVSPSPALLKIQQENKLLQTRISNIEDSIKASQSNMEHLLTVQQTSINTLAAQVEGLANTVNNVMQVFQSLHSNLFTQNTPDPVTPITPAQGTPDRFMTQSHIRTSTDTGNDNDISQVKKYKKVVNDNTSQHDFLPTNHHD